MAEAENKIFRVAFQGSVFIRRDIRFHRHQHIELTGVCCSFVREDIREHIAIERLTAFSEAFLCDEHTQVVGIEAYVAALNETR